MSLDTELPASSKPFQDLNELCLAHGSWRKEDGIPLETIDHRGSTNELSEECVEPAQHEQADQDAIHGLDEQRMVRREDRRNVDQRGTLCVREVEGIFNPGRDVAVRKWMVWLESIEMRKKSLVISNAFLE